MLFLNSQFIGEMHSLVYTPIESDNYKKITLENALIDTFSMTKDVTTEPSSRPVTEWDVDTILYAEYNKTVSAGSVDWQKTDTPMFLIKRRESGADDNSWITLAKHDITDGDSVNSLGVDFLNASKTTYDYAFVPIRNGSEGEYIMNTVYSEFDGICVMEKGSYWWSPITNANSDRSRVVEKSTNTMLNNRYPVTVTRAITNYDSGQATGMFVPFDEVECKFITEDNSRVRYQKKFMDFLTNYQPKIYKTLDGEIWLVDVSPSPSNNANSAYYDRYVTFDWYEIGKHDSEQDLYRSNLLDVEEEYWSRTYA